MTLEETQQQVEAYDALCRHPGWQLLVEHIKRQADSALASMRNSKTSDELLRHTYTYMSLSDLPKAPEMLRDILAQNLQRKLERK